MAKGYKNYDPFVIKVNVEVDIDYDQWSSRGPIVDGFRGVWVGSYPSKYFTYNFKRIFIYIKYKNLQNKMITNT